MIGYYYQNPENGFAAIKAFTVTRIGDVFLLIALFLLYQQFGSSNECGYRKRKQDESGIG